MTLHLPRLATALLVVFVGFFSVSSMGYANNAFNQIVIFGDSLSDNGNLYRSSLHMVPESPPYFEGHFSNGPVWSDLAIEHFKGSKVTITNYAVGGETINLLDTGLPYTLKDSMNSYFIRSAFSDRSHTLFVLWIGANDYLGGSADPETTTTAVMKTLKENISTLMAKGGKNFLLVNLPDLAMTPLARENPNLANLHTLTTLHNAKLQQMMTELQASNKDTIFQMVDIFGTYNDLMAHTSDYNQKYHVSLSNLTESCWTGGYYRENKAAQRPDHMMKEFMQRNAKLTPVQAKTLAQFVQSSPDLMTAYRVAEQIKAGGYDSVCNNPENYIFWDHVHPTSSVQTIIGSVMLDKIDNGYIVK